MHCPGGILSAARRSLLVAAAALAAAGTVRAAVIHVDADATGLDDGTSWTNAYTDLQAALGEARNTGSPGDEIWVAEGTYVPGTLRTDTFLLAPDIGLYGGFQGIEAARGERDWTTRVTVLSGDVLGDDGADFANYLDNVYHVVTGAAGAVLDGFTVTAGYASEAFPDNCGAGMQVDGCTMITIANSTFSSCAGSNGPALRINDTQGTVTACVFTGNVAWGYGGAVHLAGAPASSMVDCAFVDNRADDGGAIYVPGTDAAITGCTFTGNSADHYGGVMYLFGGSPVVTECTFSGNSAAVRGGAVYAKTYYGGNPEFRRCEFTANSSAAGGATYTEYVDSWPRYYNCVFAHNTASSWSGATFIERGYPQLVNCIFWHNSADVSGGIAGWLSASSPTLVNCISWGNDAPTGPELNDGVGPATVTYSLMEYGYAGAGNITSYPLLIDPDNGDFHLRPGSPCIDAADGNAAPATDIEGNARVNDTGTDDTGTGGIAYADMGPFEFQGTTPASWIATYAPPRGSLFKVGADAEVRWASSSDVGDVKIEVSRDNAASWEVVSAAETNDGSFTWTVTAGAVPLPQMECFLRVSPAGASDPNGVSPEFVIFSGVWYVDVSAPAGGGGMSWDEAFQDLQDALAVAKSGEEVWVADGTHVPGATETDSFRIPEGVAIYGGFQGIPVNETLRSQRDWVAYPTNLSGDVLGDDIPDFSNHTENVYHVVTASTDSTIDGFFVTGGYGYEPGVAEGGGFYADTASGVTVANCTFTSNIASGGSAALVIDSSVVTFVDNVFTGNEASSPLGESSLSCISSSDVLLQRCAFADNNGGVSLKSTVDTVVQNCDFMSTWKGLNCDSIMGIDVTGCTFDGNFSGMYVLWPNNLYAITVSGCTFTSNDYSPNHGSGIRLVDAVATITNCDFQNNLGDALGLEGGGGSLISQCDFVGNERGIYGGGPGTTIENCTFTGNSGNTGSAMFCASATVTGCVFTANTASLWGGAVTVDGNSPVFVSCQFDGNISEGYGGAVHLDMSAAAFTDCTFTGNSATGDGGAISCEGAAPSLTGCTFAGNSASKGGGLAGFSAYPGFGHIASEPVVTDCAFQANTASTGGAVANTCDSSFVSQPEYRNCVFAGNTSTGPAGAMYNSYAAPAVTNCTFLGNDAAGTGNVLYNSSSSPVLANCILWDSVVPAEPLIAGVGTGTCTVTYSDVRGGYVGQGNINSPPAFVDGMDPDGADDTFGTADDGLRLEPTGFCVDAGDDAAVPGDVTTDIVGDPRIQGAAVDMGAYEVTPNELPVADIVATPQTGPAPLDVHFDGTGSSDSDGTITGYLWELAGVTIAATAECDVSFPDTRAEPTTYTVTLTVTDDSGGTDSSDVLITVDPPTDTDGDGMPDYWEGLYAGLGFDPASTDESALNFDSDALTNLEEYQNGTDPGSADTDGDLMPDDWEVQYGLDPLVDDAAEDEDADTLGNLLEYQIGTKPDATDSDGDGLPDSWEYQYYDGAEPTKLDPALADSDGNGTPDGDEDDDGDGFTNYQECMAGSDPTDPASVPPAPSGSGCVPGGRAGLPFAAGLAFAAACLALRRRSRGCPSR